MSHSKNAPLHRIAGIRTLFFLHMSGNPLSAVPPHSSTTGDMAFLVPRFQFKHLVREK